MFDGTLKRQDKQLVTLMRWWAFLFIGAGAVFAVFPDQVTKYINLVGRTVFSWSAPPILPSTEKFWLILAVSLMTVLVISAIKAQANIVKNIFYVKIIILSKLASTIGYVTAFLMLEHSFGYLVGAIVDGTIMIITWIFYKRAIHVR